jgi:hypothetical protein
MAKDDLLWGLGVLLHGDGEAKPTFLGTCFAFRQRTIFLTAAHSTGNLPADALFIGCPALNQGRPTKVIRVLRHPTADIAALFIEAAGTSAVRPLHTLSAGY